MISDLSFDQSSNWNSSHPFSVSGSSGFFLPGINGLHYLAGLGGDAPPAA